MKVFQLGPKLRKKLTKTFLIELQEGDYLVSNLFPSKDKSAFAEKVSPLFERKKQWKRIVESRVDQRLCHVFKTKREYKAWLKTG